MSLFAVTREAGPNWTAGKGAFEQPGAADHAAYMNTLAAAGIVVVAGPLARSEQDRIRVLLIADAASETDVRRHLADDPWEHAERLATITVESWSPLVGAARLSPQQPA